MTYRILTVCTGNICRSPMAEYALREAIAGSDLDGRVEVVSGAVTPWEAGNPIDRRAAALLSDHGIDTTEHRAKAVDASDVAAADLVLAMDHDHVEPLLALAGESGRDKVVLVRAFDPDAGSDHGIRDPWYGDDTDFELSWDQISDAVPGILEHARHALGSGGAGEGKGAAS